MAPEAITFNGTVEFVEPTGAQTQVSVRVADRTVTALFNGVQKFKAGELLTLGVKPEQVFVFDAKTEQRL